MSKFVLPVTTHIPTNSYFALSLPLAVILSHQETREWYLENFINIYMENHNNICFTDIGFGILCRYTSVFDYSISKYEDTISVNIIDRVRHELLNEHNYAYLYMDEYYISCKLAYKSYHFHHQSLIYGFDDEKQILNALAFDMDGHFAELEYKYSEVITAYSEAFKCVPETKNDTFGVVFFKINTGFSHKLNLSHIIHSLSEYVNGCIPKNLHYIQHNMPHITFIQDKNCTFGINVIRKLSVLFQDTYPQEYTYMDFRRVHFLYEHATMLLERFHYINQKFFLQHGSSEFDELISKYESIVKKYSTIRLMVLKIRYILKTSETPWLHKRYFKNTSLELPKRLLEIYYEEKQIVTQIVRILSSMIHINCDKNSLSYDILPLAKITEEYSLIKFHFVHPCGVEHLEFDCISDMAVYVNDEYYDSFYHFSGLDKTTQVVLNQSVHKIIFENLSGKQLLYSDMNIRLIGGNLLLGKKISSSSNWHGDDGKYIDKKHLPEKVIDGNKDSYWRAAEQKVGYDGSDWLEVDLGNVEIVNTILINELNYSHRLKKYTLMYTDSKDRQIVL